MKGVQILGFKKSGKTTLCEALLGRFAANGLTACALKCTHNPGLDKEDTDTDRFLPHCRAVGAIAGQESAIFWNGARDVADMVSLLAGDVLVMEGGREQALAPRVLVLNDPEEAEKLSAPGLVLAVFGPVAASGLPNVPHLTDVAELADLVLRKGFVLPGLDCGACGRENCGELGADILAGRATLTDCATRTATMTVTVAGRSLELNPFVERILTAGIRGLLSELKGFSSGPIDIRIG